MNLWFVSARPEIGEQLQRAAEGVRPDLRVRRRESTEGIDAGLVIIDVARGAVVETTLALVARPGCTVLLLRTDEECNVGETFDAMPLGVQGLLELGRGERWKLELAAHVHRAIRDGKTTLNPSSQRVAVAPIVALGSSAGGPQAVARILSMLTTSIEAAVVVIQHLDERFMGGFGAWLTATTPFRATIAQEGELPRAGRLYLARGGDHLVVTDGRLGYRRATADSLLSPSVNVFFESAVDSSTRGVAVVLSGMGADGARGLLALRRAGWPTIAQDRATSGVYGMPKAAADLAAATQILALDAIAPAIENHVKGAAP